MAQSYKVFGERKSYQIDGEVVYGYSLLVDVGYATLRFKARPEVLAELCELRISDVKTCPPDTRIPVGELTLES